VAGLAAKGQAREGIESVVGKLRGGGKTVKRYLECLHRGGVCVGSARRVKKKNV